MHNEIIETRQLGRQTPRYPTIRRKNGGRYAPQFLRDMLRDCDLVYEEWFEDLMQYDEPFFGIVQNIASEAMPAIQRGTWLTG